MISNEVTVIVRLFCIILYMYYQTLNFSGFFLTLGDPAMLHKLIVDGSIEMEKLQDYSHEELVKFCSTCKVPTSGFSKVILELFI